MNKILLIFFMSMAFIITFGPAFAAEDMSEPKGSDKTIHDEDLQYLQLDQDRATVNQMTAVPGSEGSGAGGESKDSDTMYKDTDQYTTPIETPAKPGTEGSGGSRDDSYSPGY